VDLYLPRFKLRINQGWISLNDYTRNTNDRLNPHILHPMLDILFDEKIAGSFHFTPGQAYKTAGNGNTSRIHWDMVCIQRPDYGGGEVWFDGKLIRKDGLFTLPALKKLNPDQLLGKAR
jgi:aminopeptidase